MKAIWITTAATAVLIAACAEPAPEPAEERAAPAETEAAEAASDQAQMAENSMDADEADGAGSLAAVLADPRRENDLGRDAFRNPAATMEFFGVQPDDTVAEALPGGGWYTRVILPYIAEDGRYVALNYSSEQWAEMYGDRWNEETAAQMAAWPDTAPADLAENGPVTADEIDAYMIGSIPESEDGGADVVLMVRALHHMTKFEDDYLGEGLADIYDFLRPGGIVGVVQHRAPEDMDADMATGTRGYIKQSDVIAAFEAAGFELEASSEINANPGDTADHEQGVWGMAPSNAGDSEEEDVAPPQSLGESDRMTLKFRKPE